MLVEAPFYPTIVKPHVQHYAFLKIRDVIQRDVYLADLGRPKVDINLYGACSSKALSTR
jgi:hypothetical protein